MNLPITRGIVTVAISLTVLGLWISQSSALPIGVYRVGQAIIIPFLLFVFGIGAFQIYRGVMQDRASADSEKPIEDDPDGRFRFVAADEAAQLSAEIKLGSPFAAGTALPLEAIGQEIDFEAGVWRETALGGLLASIIMIVFGIAALFIFPTGAILISGLGCLLGVFALISRRPYVGLAATFANLAVLVAGLGRLLA